MINNPLGEWRPEFDRLSGFPCHLVPRIDMFGAVPDWKLEELSGTEIPIITPFTKENLNGYGYDVTLSGSLWKLCNWCGPIDPLNPPPDDAWKRIEHKNGEKVIVSPGELWLALTEEWFNIPSNMICLMLNRSKFARAGASPNCGIAPGEPGWSGRFVLELEASARPVVYTVGACVAQVMFIAGAPCRNPYSSKEHVYQNQEAILGPMAHERELK